MTARTRYLVKGESRLGTLTAHFSCIHEVLVRVFSASGREKGRELLVPRYLLRAEAALTVDDDPARIRFRYVTTTVSLFPCIPT